MIDEVETPAPIFGTNDDDTFWAGVDFNGESDRLFTGAGDDEVDVPIGEVNKGGNRINTGSGEDTIFVGNRGRVFGGSDDDWFEATDSSRYRVSGNDGDDTFFLGHNGRALGSNGDDAFFVWEKGDNLLAGGAGADAFWIIDGQLPDSPNTITDFELGTDVLGILGSVSNISGLTLENDTIAVGVQVVAQLIGIDTASLTAANFVFA